MLKKWLRNLARPRGKSPAAPISPTIIARDNHPISRKHISKNALKVMSRLLEAGYETYLVGGGVRDLLLGQEPKDFDVATSATPEQVAQLFRNSRMIGRRFRIVHVLFGREVIEVTTFRAGHDADDEDEHASARTSSGMLLRDNIYGTVEEDARRRDFTVNALYYTTEDFSVHDYHNGLLDLEQRCIRMIGDPELRYREDPVRMLRAARFAAKLDFEVEIRTGQAIFRLGHLLQNVPPARMFDEVLKLLLCQHAVASFEQLLHFQLLKYITPGAFRLLDESNYLAFIKQALVSTEQRLSEDKSVNPAFLYAALLWPVVDSEMRRMTEAGTSPMAALHEAANMAIHEQNASTAIPRRFQIPMREIWEMQIRLPSPGGKRAERLVTHPRFRAGFDFLALRSQAGEDLADLVSWWEAYQAGDDDARLDLVKQQATSGANKRPRKNRNRYRRKPS